MGTSFLWVKALHLVLVASGFAGLFYLPRILVNLAMVPSHSEQERQRLLVMARKLYRFSFGLMGLGVAVGLVLWLGYGVGLRGPGNGWMHAKLFLVLLTLGYHLVCGRLLRAFEVGQNRHSHRWFRVFNEVSVLLFAAIVILVVVKPF